MSEANGRTVVITGASSGIGRASALLAASRGWTVLAGVRKSSDADALRAEAGDRVRPLLLDLTDARSIAVAAEQVRQLVGETGLDGLVNNAGAGLSAPMEYVPMEAVRRLFEGASLLFRGWCLRASSIASSCACSAYRPSSDWREHGPKAKSRALGRGRGRGSHAGRRHPSLPRKGVVARAGFAKRRHRRVGSPWPSSRTAWRRECVGHRIELRTAIAKRSVGPLTHVVPGRAVIAHTEVPFGRSAQRGDRRRAAHVSAPDGGRGLPDDLRVMPAHLSGGACIGGVIVRRLLVDPARDRRCDALARGAGRDVLADTARGAPGAT